MLTNLSTFQRQESYFNIYSSMGFMRISLFPVLALVTAKKGHPFWNLAGRSFLRTIIITLMLKLSVQASFQNFQAFMFPLTLDKGQLNLTGRNLWWNGSSWCNYSSIKRAVQRWCIQMFIACRETGLLNYFELA